MMEDVPMIVEEAEVEEGEAEDLVLDAIDEAEVQQQQYEPYQLTHYYRNQLEQFQADYISW